MVNLCNYLPNSLALFWLARFHSFRSMKRIRRGDLSVWSTNSMIGMSNWWCQQKRPYLICIRVEDWGLNLSGPKAVCLKCKAQSIWVPNILYKSVGQDLRFLLRLGFGCCLWPLPWVRCGLSKFKSIRVQKLAQTGRYSQKIPGQCRTSTRGLSLAQIDQKVRR